MQPTQDLIQNLERHAEPLRDHLDLQWLTRKLASHKIVMLGESSHGTQEFYKWRRLISQELIAHHGFNFIAVEGDWPPCYELNRYVKNQTQNLRATFQHFHRWPTWMWANTEAILLSQWMNENNRDRSESQKSGFYGLDVYSLFESIDEALKQAKIIDEKLHQELKKQYECFGPYQRNEKYYARSLRTIPKGCEDQVLAALKSLLSYRLEGVQDENLFDAQQNARIVKNAENYYRTMILGTEDSWNVRDRHMMETLNLLIERHGPDSKCIVWAHNTHIGDYRATDMVEEGQINIGGLARKFWGAKNVALLGFGTHHGEVIASHAWGGPTEIMTIPDGRPGSCEDLFHQVAQKMNQNAFCIWLKDDLRHDELKQTLGHRAIGVVYQPHYERYGNYVPTTIADRYDGFIFIDQTSALTPIAQPIDGTEIPETWPQGF